MAEQNPTPTARRTAPKERPIPFTGEMVRAILGGRKSQTRRLVRDQSTVSDIAGGGVEPVVWWPIKRNGDDVLCPYGVPGDRLWAKETWALRDDVNWKMQPDKAALYVLHREGYVGSLDNEYHHASRWRSGRFMPRILSRITLEVTGVRVQRLQEISEEDAKAEGCDGYVNGHGPVSAMALAAEPGFMHPNFYRQGYQFLWESINAKPRRQRDPETGQWRRVPRAPWSSNPWVWAISFRRVA